MSPALLNRSFLPVGLLVSAVACGGGRFSSEGQSSGGGAGVGGSAPADSGGGEAPGSAGQGTGAIGGQQQGGSSASGPSTGGQTHSSGGGGVGSTGGPATGGMNSGGSTASGGVGPLGGAGSGAAGGARPDCPDDMAPAEGYCVDRLEIEAQIYLAWVATDPPVAGQPQGCRWNDSFRPSCSFDPGVPSQPVRCIDWCDAAAYCGSLGRRLCGSIAGGPSDFEQMTEDTDQWYAACAGPERLAYPYGDEYDAAACDGKDRPGGTILRADAPDCEGGYASLMDLSGNVAEWVDSCNGTSGESDLCLFRGGSIGAEVSQLTCESRQVAVRNLHSQYIGFRCCLD